MLFLIDIARVLQHNLGHFLILDIQVLNQVFFLKLKLHVTCVSLFRRSFDIVQQPRMSFLNLFRPDEKQFLERKSLLVLGDLLDRVIVNALKLRYCIEVLLFSYVTLFLKASFSRVQF